MRLLSFAAAAALAACLAVSPAFAQSTGMKNGSNDAGTTKSRCSPGDPNVMVNIKSKTYTLDKSAKAPAMSGSNSMSKTSDAAATSSDASGSSSTMKSMCKSEAESMGAKMTSGMQKKSM